MSDSQVESNSLVKCDVCLRNYDESRKQKFLPCLHSFCQSCLTKIKQNDRIKCPICRKSHGYSGDVSFLPNSYFGVLKEIERKMNHEIETKVATRILNLEMENTVQILELQTQIARMELLLAKQEWLVNSMKIILKFRIEQIENKFNDERLESKKSRKSS